MGEEFQCVVLTYDAPHRKTYDTLCLLKAKGYRRVLVWAVPFSYVKTHVPLYEHRPKAVVEIPPKELCQNLGFLFHRSDAGYEGLLDYGDTPILICGAGLIPDAYVSRLRLINAHPGYIPLVRGLDAFKWAIHEDLPIGVTTHYLGREVDAGEVIERQVIPVYENDTFHSVAQRVYESEVGLLVAALRSERTQMIPAGEAPLHRRMPESVECELMQDFERYKQSHCVRRG